MNSANDNRVGYEHKFAEFINLLAATQEELVIVHHPQALGDNYAELVESLDRIANARKKLVILPVGERD